MPEIYFYNTLTRTKEKFVPIDSSLVRMYTCGPTVYDYASIGNWRTYTTSDLIVRTLEYNGYSVDYIMNLTDVGHLTGDNLGDADRGEDRLEKTAKKERKTAWEVADFYAKDFIRSFDRLNLRRPRLFAKATDHLGEQIELIKRLEKVGFTYRTSDGIYFSVADFEKSGQTYGGLSSLDEIKAGARVAPNLEKKDVRDFAVWKFSPENVKRDMEWASPWGVGFPGWHLECSAMGMKYLGDQFDVHVGGEDLRQTHHPNEVAQSEAVTGKKPFVRYWLHGAFLLVDGGRMGKSLGNVYTLADVENRGFSPLALRYLFLTGHYRKQLNFTWDSLTASQKALDRLRSAFASESAGFSSAKAPVGGTEYEEKFSAAVNDDLDLPQALAVVWELTKSDLPAAAKRASLLKFDRILGLDLAQPTEAGTAAPVPDEVGRLYQEREAARERKDYRHADELREQIANLGYYLEDGPTVTKLRKK